MSKFKKRYRTKGNRKKKLFPYNQNQEHKNGEKNILIYV